MYGVDYDKRNTLTSSGVAKMTSAEIAKSRKGVQDRINAFDKSYNKRIGELVTKATQHANNANSLYPKIPSNNNTTTGGGRTGGGGRVNKTGRTNKNTTNTIDTANDTLKNAIVEASNKINFL